MSQSLARAQSAADNTGRRQLWLKTSTSTKSSGFNDIFADPHPLGTHTTVGKVFTINDSMKYSNYRGFGHTTTRSMPDPFRHHNVHTITNGHATTGRRQYLSRNAHKPQMRRLISNSSKSKRFLERKEDAFEFFDIEMDKPTYYQYRPGEEIAGAVHMDIRHVVEVRYVELLIVGHGKITVRKAKNGLPSTSKETYLSKQTFVIGTGDATWSSVLTPGHYLSKFRFRLPKHLPSSLKHDDLSSGFSIDINYFIKARICDDVGLSSSIRSTSSSNRLVNVLLSKKQPFTIQRSFDINLIPSASTPLTHSEEVYLTCTGHNQALVTLSLERAVLLAGDDIKLQLAAALPPSQRVKSISCKLQQHVKLSHQSDMTTFALSKIERTDPQSTSLVKDESSYDVTIPTQTNLVTSFLQGCSMVRITYSLAIQMRFTPAGGKLSLTIPLGIGPCAEPIYAQKISSRKAVPIFNRATRFPCFSPSTVKPPLQVDHSSRSSQSINVVTEYKNSFWAKCFLCCFASTRNIE